MSVKITPSSLLASTPCVRVYHQGHTFRLARGDTHVAVFRGTVIEQRRYLVIHDCLPPGPVVEGEQTPLGAIATPPGHTWFDTASLHDLAVLWVSANAPSAPPTGWQSVRPAR